MVVLIALPVAQELHSCDELSPTGRQEPLAEPVVARARAGWHFIAAEDGLNQGCNVHLPVVFPQFSLGVREQPGCQGLGIVN